jgi:hypothetical protein
LNIYGMKILKKIYLKLNNREKINDLIINVCYIILYVKYFDYQSLLKEK